MDLNKHGFWVGMGAAAALALGLYAALIPFGVGATIQKKEVELRRAVRELQGFATKPDEEVGDIHNGLPIQALADYWEERQQKLRTESDRIRDHLRKLDRELEKVTGGYDADVAKFVPTINRDLTKLNDDFADLLPAGKKFTDIAPVLPQNDITPDQIGLVQKRFYITRAIAQAALAAGASKLVAIQFDEPQGPPAGADPNRVSVTLLGARATILMGAPGRLDVSKKRAGVLRELGLDEDSPVGVVALLSALVKHPKVVMRISKMTATAAPFEVPELEPWKVFAQRTAPRPVGPAQPTARKSFDQDVYLAQQDTNSVESKDPPPELREPPIQVVVRVEALDFHIPGGSGDGR